MDLADDVWTMIVAMLDARDMIRLAKVSRPLHVLTTRCLGEFPSVARALGARRLLASPGLRAARPFLLEYASSVHMVAMMSRTRVRVEWLDNTRLELWTAKNILDKVVTDPRLRAMPHDGTTASIVFRHSICGPVCEISLLVKFRDATMSWSAAFGTELRLPWPGHIVRAYKRVPVQRGSIGICCAPAV